MVQSSIDYLRGNELYQELIKNNDQDDHDILRGFHLPPSVRHLHMHIALKKSNMNLHNKNRMLKLTHKKCSWVDIDYLYQHSEDLFPK